MDFWDPLIPMLPVFLGTLLRRILSLWLFFWVEVVLIEAFIEIEGFWPLGANGP